MMHLFLYRVLGWPVPRFWRAALIGHLPGGPDVRKVGPQRPPQRIHRAMGGRKQGAKADDRGGQNQRRRQPDARARNEMVGS